MSTAADLQSKLESLRTALPELKGALVASTDGLTIAYSINAGDPNRMAAMVATALGLGKRIAEAFGAGVLSETTVAASEGQIFVYAAGPKGVLAVVAPMGMNVGLIHLESRESAKKIAHSLGA